jgi:Domain of Unknown Function (DUF1080)
MRRPAILLVAAVLLGGIALADRETAQFQAGRGDKSLAAKKWDEAEASYRKSLDEDAAYLPARYGLAQALFGAGKSAPAVDELRKFLEDARSAPSLPAEWKPLCAKAEKQLGDVDASGAALQKITDAFTDGLLDVAQRWTTKDPALAERALRRLLEVRPGHTKATELLAKLGKFAAGEVVELLDGKGLAGWKLAGSPIWEWADGELVANCRDCAKICHTEREFEGDFTVRAEMRLLEPYAPPLLFAVLPSFRSDYEHYTVGVFSGRVRCFDTTGPAATRDVVALAFADLKKPFDPKQWNTFEFRCHGNEAVFVINGDVVGREPRTEARGSGKVGLLVQNGRVAFRRIVVEVR